MPGVVADQAAMSSSGEAFFGNLSGSGAKRLLKHGGDVGCLRPWIDKRTGKSFITLKVRDRDGNLVMNRFTKRPAEDNIRINNDATLFYDEWKYVDKAIQRVTRKPLQAWKDLRDNFTLRIPNGMATTVMRWQGITDSGVANISMDGLRQGPRSRPTISTNYLPIPIIHGDFSFNLRYIEETRKGNYPIDTFMVEQTTHKCLVKAEGLTIGTEPSYTYDGGTIYGMTNHPSRTTYSMTSPTSGGWTPDTTVNDVLNMRQDMINNLMWGPWRLYTSPGFDAYLDTDYSSAKGDNTLRDRLLKIKGIQSVEPLFFLNDFQMLLVRYSSDVSRAIVGMDPRPFEWEEEGGWELMFKIAMIWVPHFRPNMNGVMGIVHAS